MGTGVWERLSVDGKVEERKSIAGKSILFPECAVVSVQKFFVFEASVVRNL